MKKYSLYLIALVAIMQSCKEQIPAGLLLSSLISVDTTYISAQIETPQTKKIVIEELTGVACTNCPAGTDILKGFVTQYPNRILLTAIHSGFLTDPTQHSIYDFRNSDADELRLFFSEGDPPKPGATFDRVPAVGGGSDGKYFITKGQTGADWITALNSRLTKATPVNIHLTSSYNATTNKVTVLVKIHFTSAVTDKLGLTLYVLESGKKDVQESAGVGEIPDYEFNHILSKIITPVPGQGILDSLATKEAGRTLEKSLQFEAKIDGVNAWNLDSCVIVGIVHKTGVSKEVLHAEEVHLK